MKNQGTIGILGILLCALACGGCSVVMAAAGSPDPDLGVVRAGASRGEIEMQLGKPISTTSVDEGRVDVYEYEMGNKPSAGRAIAHGIADVCTLCLWEIVGTPIEAFQGEKHRITVYYNHADEALSINNRPEAWTVQAKKEEELAADG